MESFRNPDFVERYEGCSIWTPIAVNLANGVQVRKKVGYKFVAENGEVAPLDWYISSY